MKDVVSITQALFALSKVSYTSQNFSFLLMYLFTHIPDHNNRKLLNWNRRTTSSSKRSPLLQNSSQSLTAGCAMNSRWKSANRPTLPSLSRTRSLRRSRMRRSKGTYWLTQSQKLNVSIVPFSLFALPLFGPWSRFDTSLIFTSIPNSIHAYFVFLELVKANAI